MEQSFMKANVSRVTLNLLMNISPKFIAVVLALASVACSRSTIENPSRQPHDLPSIAGSPQYLQSPFVTAGDRVYMVGHQDGTFPDLGWHIEGEMGGIWNHPVKLMDGFQAAVSVEGREEKYCLDRAHRFVNYPMANSHEFIWDSEEIAVERFQFVPDGVEGMVVEFRFRNTGNAAKNLVFSFTGMSDLRPTWLGERTGMVDAEDTIFFSDDLKAVVAKDRDNPWYVAFGSSAETTTDFDASSACDRVTRRGSGKNGTLVFRFNLKPGEQKLIPVCIAGSYRSQQDLRATYESILRDRAALFAQKVERYDRIRNNSHLVIQDEEIAQMYEWLKYNVDWLVRNVPEQGVGISAGLPDYPWWFGADMTYALQGVLATGDHFLARNSIMLLHELSVKTNGNGRIIHEASTNGAVYNPGNVNETAQFISLVKTYYDWTGDRELILDLLPDIKKGITWLLKDMDPDGDGYPNGSGMMEIPGLDTEMIDVAVYTQQALEAAAALLRNVGDDIAADDYQKRASDLKERINGEWWIAEARSFGDFRASVAEASSVLRAALIRADTLKKPWAVAELREGARKLTRQSGGTDIPHVIYHNWVVNTPMETGIADANKGQQALETARKYENPFGVFVTGIDRTQEADSIVLKSRKKTFSYTGAVMTLPTGVQAVAAARYGSPDDALDYLQKLRRSFSYALPGSMYEVSPDFGMVTQAWNIYGVAVPIIQHFFGIQPRAYEKSIYISPRMPSSWTNSSVENVKVGDNVFSYTCQKNADHTRYHIVQSGSDWKIVFNVEKATKVIVNGREHQPSTGQVELTGKENTMLVFY